MSVAAHSFAKVMKNDNSLKLLSLLLWAVLWARLHVKPDLKLDPGLYDCLVQQNGNTAATPGTFKDMLVFYSNI